MLVVIHFVHISGSYVICVGFRTTNSPICFLLTNKQSTKPVTNNSCKGEPVNDRDDDDYTDDCYDFCHSDSDDEEEQQKRR